MFEDFGVALESGTTGALSQLAGDLGRDNTIERTLFETRMRAMMAGRLFVREFEQKRLTSRQLNRDNPNFLELPFSEAIDDFLRRSGMSRDDFALLTEEEMQAAFRAARAYSDAVVQRMGDHIERAMASADGPDDREFLQTFRSQVDANDLPGGARGYTNNVFRTATATSYNAGRLGQQQDAGVELFEYLAVEDGRARESHLALSGRVFRADDPVLMQVYPPSGFQCRCVVIGADPEDVTEIRGADGVDMTGFFDEASFRGPPA